ncbi:MAG: TrkH family potassium uptake protein [Gaiellaceae bacterium]
MTALARRGTIGVDVAAALNLVGGLVKYLALAFLFPVAVAVGYGESPWPFVAAGAITAAAGLLLELVTQGKEHVGAREGFLVVALTWFLAALFGCLPYLFSGEPQLSNPVDAYFEAMSGFTTTGASVLTDIEGLSRSLLMWRQFTQWLGGMGIIVLALAVLPRLRIGGRQLFESEMPGPDVERLTTSIRETARRLWVLYVALTAAVIALLGLWAVSGIDEEMTLYDAAAHAFTTMPTGGFSPRDASLSEFGAATQWTVLVFMVLGGANFALLYAALVRRRARPLLRDDEFRLYVGLAIVATLVLFGELLARGLFEGEAAFRHAAFQAVSIMTTSGFASADYTQWTTLALVGLVGLMLIGGSAGSTSGSIKVVRHLIIGRSLRRELDVSVHPELISPLRFNRRPVDEKTVRAVIAFVLLYVGAFALGALLITIDAAVKGVVVTPFEAIAAAAATIGNVGPSVGFAGPFGSYESFSDTSKGVMIVLMWMGRLELVPVIVLFTRSYWRA